MSKQYTVMSLFDLPSPDEAARRRDKGIADAVRHTGQPWVEYATQFIYCYLIFHDTLFCDDVWAAGLAAPESPRAFGQVMKNALQAGWMSKSGQARPSVNSNHSIRPTYRSEIYDPTTPIDDYPVWAASGQEPTP